MVKENLKQNLRLTYKEKLQMQISVLVCDDDKKFGQDMVELLRALTENYSIKITGCSQPEKLTDKFLGDFQIMFLDIDMGNYNGLEIARRVRKLKLDTVLIFVTHYMEYSPEGYEVNAFRYLLKENIKDKLPNYLKEAIREVQSHADSLMFTINGEQCVIKYNDILYLESSKRLIYLHLADEQKEDRCFYSIMDELEEQLTSAGFLRVHKSYLVNCRYIYSIEKNQLVLDDKTVIPVSRYKAETVKQKFRNYLRRTL